MSDKATIAAVDQVTIHSLELWTSCPRLVCMLPAGRRSLCCSLHALTSALFNPSCGQTIKKAGLVKATEISGIQYNTVYRRPYTHMSAVGSAWSAGERGGARVAGGPGGHLHVHQKVLTHAQMRGASRASTTPASRP